MRTIILLLLNSRIQVIYSRLARSKTTLLSNLATTLLISFGLMGCLKASRSPFDISSPSGAIGSGLVFSFDNASTKPDGSSTTYTIGGNIAGFTSGTLVLQLNGGVDVSLTPVSSYQIGSIGANTTYTVTIKTNPVGFTCTIANGSGTAMANVTNADITCTASALASYTIGGTISGLSSGTLVLRNNGSDDLNVNAGASSFQFASSVTSGSTYSVSIQSQPSSLSCSIANATGTAGANVTNVTITCSVITYTVSGTISGLSSGALVVQNNGGNDLNISASSTSFQFTSAIASNSSYAVTILTQPSGLTCSVSSGNGTISANVTNVVITCSTTTYTIGGTITGLTTGQLIVQNNGANDLSIISGATSFLFTTAIAHNSAYSVTVKQHPTGLVCILTNTTGTATTNVTNVTVTCTTAVVIRHYTPPTETQWLHYIKRNGTDYLTANNTLCDGTETGNYFYACINTAEVRKFDIPNQTSCSNFTAEDNLKAFYWNCKANTNSLTFYSTSLREGKFLSDLIDWSLASPDWNLMKLSVKLSGAAYAETSSTKWWSTAPTVFSSAAGGTVGDGSSKLFVTVSDLDASDGYRITNSNTAWVIKPGIRVRISPCPAGNVITFTTANAPFYWVEGEFDANEICNTGVRVTNRFTVLKNVKIKNTTNAGGTVTRYNIYILSSKNLLENIVSANSRNTAGYGMQGIMLGDVPTGTPASDNILKNIVLSNNATNGIWLTMTGSSNNSFFNIVSFANTNGINTSNTTGPLYLFNATLANNNGAGIYLNGLTNLYSQNLISMNNTQRGFEATVAANINVTLTSQSSIIQSNDTGNNSYNIMVENFGSGSSSKFTGVFKADANSCNINTTFAGLNNAATPSDCRPLSPSDYNSNLSNQPITSPLISSSTFVGGGVSDTSWTAAGNTYANSLNWTSFTNIFRGVGLSSSGFPLSGRGLCAGTATCYLWDWSLQSGDTIAKNANLSTAGTGCPNGTSTSTITHSTTTFLRNTVEILGDGIGDDDGFCESNEDCLFTPNIGAYQGHGNIVSASQTTAGTSYTCSDIGAGGTIQNVKLYKYENNGY